MMIFLFDYNVLAYADYTQFCMGKLNSQSTNELFKQQFKGQMVELIFSRKPWREYIFA